LGIALNLYKTIKETSMEILKGQQLLKKSGVVVDADEALDGKKIICLYFSAHWCPPCREFTPVLADFYGELVKEDEPLEVIFVSGDNSPNELLGYMKNCHGDWLAVQHGARLIGDLTDRYKVAGIPTLVVLTRDGQVITNNGRSEVTEKGTKVFQHWLAVALSASLTSNLRDSIDR